MTFNPANSLGPFLPSSLFFPEEFEEFRVDFLQAYRNIANCVNTRDVGVFDLEEFLTGQRWFTSGDAQRKRSTFRIAYSIGAIAAGATLNIPHGLTNITAITKRSGEAITDVVDYRPIPYASATLVTDQIEIRLNTTNIVIINGATAPNITSAIVVLEYLKN